LTYKDLIQHLFKNSKYLAKVLRVKRAAIKYLINAEVTSPKHLMLVNWAVKNLLNKNRIQLKMKKRDNFIKLKRQGGKY